MRGEKEKTICLWAAAALIFTAVVCRFLGMLFIHADHMGLARSAIYIFRYTAWAVSVRNRIIHVRIRRYLTAIARRCSMPPPWAFRSPTRTIRSFCPPQRRRDIGAIQGSGTPPYFVYGK